MSAPKITLLYNNKDSTSINGISWFKNKLLNNFNIEPFDSTATYKPSTHILVIDQYMHNRSGWHLPLQEAGFKIIVEYFWDSGKNKQSTIQDRVLNITSRDWVWIDRFFMNQHRGYDQRIQTVDPDKFFLLLMNLSRATRDQLFAQVTPYLHDSLYSYRGRGIEIDGDDITTPGVVAQEYSNMMWYNNTNFSLVSETLPYGIDEKELFVSEKTFKPIRLNHPFIVHGSRGTLDYLHSLGFETFDHVIDESYDLGDDANIRLKAIDLVLDMLYKEFKQSKRLFGDTESQNKIKHNFNRFHNESVINQLWQTQIVDVIQEFIDV